MMANDANCAIELNINDEVRTKINSTVATTKSFAYDSRFHHQNKAALPPGDVLLPAAIATLRHLHWPSLS